MSNVLKASGIAAELMRLVCLALRRGTDITEDELAEAFTPRREGA